jgi:hypothetical protein
MSNKFGDIFIRFTTISRYVVSLFVDIFVLGPATIAVLLCFGSWMAGEFPTKTIVAMIAEEGEGFRNAPVGHVYVVQYPTPAAGETPTRISEENINNLPRKLVPVSEWTTGLADDIFRLYVLGVFLGILVVVLMRGANNIFRLPEPSKS